MRKRHLLAVAVFVGSFSPVQAAIYNWQTAGTTNNWSTDGADTNWFIDPDTMTLAPWADSNDAVFSSTGETVTILGPLAPTSTTVGTGNGNWTFANSSTGGIGGTLVKNGNGTLTVSGTTANTFSDVTINAGTITYGTGGTATNTSNIGALGAGLITVNSGATLKYWIKNDATFNFANNIALNGGNLQTEDGINNVTGTVTLGSGGGTLSAKWSGKNLNINGVISGTGPLNLTLLAGGGTSTNINFGNVSNTYSGVTTIGAGVYFRAGNANSLGATGAGNETIVSSGATLDVNSISINGAERISIAGTGVGNIGALVNTGATGLTANALQNVSLAANATIGGTQRFDMRGGSGSLDLAGFTLTKIGANQISLVGLSGGVTSGNIIVNAGTLSLETSTVVAAAGTSTITVNSGGTLGFYQTTAANITRPIILNTGGTISNIGVAAGINSPITVNGTTTFAGGSAANTYNGLIDGTGSISFTATGQASIGSAANSYSGGTTISQNTRVNAGTNGSAFGTGLITVLGDGIVNDGQAYFGAATIANNFNISGMGGNTTDTAQRGAIRLDGATVNGSITLAGNAGIGVNSGTGTINGPINAATFTLTKNDGGTLVINSAVTNLGNLNIGTTALAGGTLTLGSGSSLNAGSFAGTITAQNTSNATLNFNSTTDHTLSGVVSGALILNKAGASVLTLTNDNTYSGATTVSAGTLSINGSLSSSTATVTINGGTLAGSGTIARPTTIAAAGALAPGNSIGTLTLPNTLTLAGTSNFEINSLSSTADLVNSVTDLTFGGTLNVSNLDLTNSYTPGQIFDLFNFTNGTGTFAAINLPALPSGYSWQDFGGSQFDYATGQIQIAAIPEPSTLICGALGLLGLGQVLLRQRRRANASPC